MTQVIIDWIASLGWDGRQELGWPLLPGQEIVDGPEKALFITGAGGPGYTTEEPATDASVFQARLRGPSEDPFAAEAAAQLLDAMVLQAQFPVVIDGVTISHAHRLSNGPTPLPLDPNDRRFEFTESFVFVTGV